MSISQEIESKISILDLANTYLQTKKAGVNYKASCPFHTEKTPSFTISPAKNIAYCFSCHRGGGPIKFLMEIEKIEFRDALQILAKRAGVELQSTYANSVNTEKNKDTYALYRYATEWYHEHLYSPDGVHALAYMHGRGMTDDILKRFQIGYSSSPRDMLYFLRSKGFDESFMVESGLFVSPTRDKFFGRVVFPIANFM
jgi:DNA primase